VLTPVSRERSSWQPTQPREVPRSAGAKSRQLHPDQARFRIEAMTRRVGAFGPVALLMAMTAELKEGIPVPIATMYVYVR
jgi:hypothetical protein